MLYQMQMVLRPKSIVQKEIDTLKDLGVKIETNMVIGKVISIEEKNGVNYALISLGVQASTTDAMGHQINILDDRVDNAEVNILAAMKAADDAHQEALKANAALKDAILKSSEALDKANSAGDNVQNIEDVLASVYAAAEQAKVLAETAIVGADKIRQEAVDFANEALDKAGEIERTVDPISRWEYTDPATGQTNTGATYFAEYVKNGLNTKADMETVSKFNEENKLLIEKNAENFQQMLSSVDKYSVGEYSQAYGLTLSQARNILKDGMVYIPTDHDGANTHAEQYVDGDKILKRYFTKGFYYVWTLVNDTEYMWSEEAGNVWHGKTKPAGNSYSYWYDGDALYILYNNEWIEVATISGNTINRITSMIRQTADNIALEVTNVRGSLAGLDMRITNNESAVTSIASYVVGEYVAVDTWTPLDKDISSIYYAKDTKLYWYYDGDWKSTEKSYEAGLDGSLSTIEQKADDNGASLSLLVSDKDGEKSINAASIVMAVNDEGPSVTIDADKINFQGQATFLVRQDDLGSKGATIIDGGRIATGAIQSLYYNYQSGNFSNRGTEIDLETGRIRSKNFAIKDDGDAFFSGHINANSGTIGDFKIDKGAIQNLTFNSFDESDANAIYIGVDGFRYGDAIYIRFEKNKENPILNSGRAHINDYYFDERVMSMIMGNTTCRLFDAGEDAQYLNGKENMTILQRLKDLEDKVANLQIGGGGGTTTNVRIVYVGDEWKIESSYNEYTVSSTGSIQTFTVDDYGYDEWVAKVYKPGDGSVTITNADDSMDYQTIKYQAYPKYTTISESKTAGNTWNFLDVQETSLYDVSSSDPSVVSVIYADGMGINLSAKSAGTATVTATYKNTNGAIYKKAVYTVQAAAVNPPASQEQNGGVKTVGDTWTVISPGTYFNNASWVGNSSSISILSNNANVGLNVKAIAEDADAYVTIKTTDGTVIKWKYVINACPHKSYDSDNKCTVCGATKPGTGGGTGGGTDTCVHTEVIIPAKAATCVESGLTEGKQCSKCSTVTVKQEVIPATGHKYVNGVCSVCGAKDNTTCAHTEEIIPGKAATCTESGLTEGKKCSKCGEIIVAQEVIPANGHTEELVSAKAPTCTEAGLTEGKKCSKCGYTLVTQQEIAALEHDLTVEVQAKDATCTAAGHTAGMKCSRCDHTTSTTIPATGHTVENIPGKAATCTESGLTGGNKCSVCGTTLAKQVEISPLGHDLSIEVEAKEATCTEDGNTAGLHCSRCSHTTSTTIVKFGHKYQRAESLPCSNCGTFLPTYECSVCFDIKTDPCPNEEWH